MGVIHIKLQNSYKENDAWVKIGDRSLERIDKDNITAEVARMVYEVKIPPEDIEIVTLKQLTETFKVEIQTD